MEDGEVREKAAPRKRAKSRSAKKPQKRFKKKEEPSTKSVPCKFYIEGRCHKGLDCIFSHSVSQIQKPDLCKFFLTNCCAKGSDCVYSHDTKAFPCKYLHGNGHCQGGNDCRFSHERLKPWEIPKFVEENLPFLREIRDKAGGTHLGGFLEEIIEEQKLLE